MADTRKGILLVEGAPPPDKLMSMRKGAKPAKEPEPDPADQKEGDETDRTAALSALHQLVGALTVEDGVITVKDEDAALSAFEDLAAACSPSYEK